MKVSGVMTESTNLETEQASVGPTVLDVLKPQQSDARLIFVQKHISS